MERGHKWGPNRTGGMFANRNAACVPRPGLASKRRGDCHASVMLEFLIMSVI